ncbi:MAG: hypothetical protein K2X03_05015 [Bryobacteraceae bacterium]|nr:hypothetical protein [Bryobacteraceae bacterium]
MRDSRSVFSVLLGDGRFLLALTGVALLFSGGFALLQSLSGHFLPHDVAAIGMDAKQLEVHVNRPLVLFMFHDRVAFGGTLLAIGMGYLWLAGFPLAAGEEWAWRAFAVSGVLGFASFLAYLGHGYLDTWHGVATLFLLPVYLAGMWRARQRCQVPPKFASDAKLGRVLLGLCALGLCSGGLVILAVGMTSVFVPSDLAFIGLDAKAIHQVAPMLVPVIAHDRAGFGGGLFSTGTILFFLARYAALTRSFIEIVFLMGSAGFVCTIGVHVAVGYTDFLHVLPAVLGFGAFLGSVAALAQAYSPKP